MPTTFQEIPRERPVTPLLDRADTPAGLRRLAEADLENLADELRQELLYTVGQTGGHFGAGLGVIELTIALHYVFDTPDDRLVWDVGHQAYPHKILTGRRQRMDTLRQKDGHRGDHVALVAVGRGFDPDPRQGAVVAGFLASVPGHQVRGDPEQPRS